jgi:hypothetical protein
VKVGDYLLCYLTGVPRFVGLPEVVKPTFKHVQPIWKADVFPRGLGVKPITMLSPQTAVPVLELRDELSIFDDSRGTVVLDWVRPWIIVAIEARRWRGCSCGTSERKTEAHRKTISRTYSG